MKQILITIAALALVGCSKPPPPDISIHKAAEEGNIEAVKIAIADGADVNARCDVQKMTPLQYAAFDECKEIAELLIVAGADVNARSKNGSTLLDFAISAYQFKIADLLRKNGGKHGTIYGAAGGGDIEAVKKFLASGTHVNAKKHIVGDTPLHGAAEHGQKEIVELLIANGADVNIANKSGRTALDMTHLRPEINELLRKHGAKWGRELEAAGN